MTKLARARFAAANVALTERVLDHVPTAELDVASIDVASVASTSLALASLALANLALAHLALARSASKTCFSGILVWGTQRATQGNQGCELGGPGEAETWSMRSKRKGLQTIQSKVYVEKSIRLERFDSDC